MVAFYFSFMEFNKRDDYFGASNFIEIDDFDLVAANVEEEEEFYFESEEDFYRKLDEY